LTFHAVTMAIVISNAWLVDIDPPAARRGGLRIEGSTIAQVSEDPAAGPGDEVVDAGGAVVMPGLVNGHMHLYSALAVGMPPPRTPPACFREILESVWWRLDRALDLPLCEISAAAGGIEALRCGVTTLIDHHASPSAIEGSLDAIESGLRQTGMRGVLCYETTDRNGSEGRDAGLAENERYLKLCEKRQDGRFAAMVGAHAAFTLSDESLAAVGGLAKRCGVGVHMHVAEDPCDAAICRERYGAGLVDRLERAGVLAVRSLLAHGTHLSDDDLRRVNSSPVLVAHNPRSNMNNAVGYAPVGKIHRPVLLGTDGIGSDMLAELQTAWFKSRDAHAGLTPADCVALLAQSARTAGERLGVELGRLKRGAAADIVLTDYTPSTALTSDNVPGHLIFGMSSRHVRSVMVGGQWRLRDRQLLDIDEPALRAHAASEVKRLRAAMQELD